ncbi:MAG TPA: 16S rRNA (uracil(1498)-N(3))-methyltransferase [Steroidobacteraceae bacterium]|nr:16S rRNA (uracil(1498)-N(3))-methyltransferase [Steroidobacteraceae bacterium]
MRQVRVYSADPLAAHSEQELGRAASAHVLRVLRLRAGDALTLFDGRGGEYPARLVRTGRAAAVVEVGAHLPLERESPLAITLLQSLARGEKMDFIVQKGTELGVARIVPVAVGRSVMRVPDGRADRKLEHWRAVAASACEQCGRNRLPQIDAPVDLPSALALATSSEMRVLLSPEAPDTLSSVVRAHGTGGTGTPCPSIALLIGPEGGLEDGEAVAAARHGFLAARFGPRVLRTETAALAAITALQVMAGDLQGT